MASRVAGPRNSARPSTSPFRTTTPTETQTTTQTQTTTATQTPPLATLAPATLPTVSKQPQLKLKLKLKLKLQLHLLRSLRSLRPRCLRSPCSEGANSSPRYARRTICTFFAISGVWQLFVFRLLVRSSLKGEKPKQPRFFVAYGLHITEWRAEVQGLAHSARPSTSPFRPSQVISIIVFILSSPPIITIIVLFPPCPPCPPSSSHPLFLSSWRAPASYFGRAHQHRQADPHPPP